MTSCLILYKTSFTDISDQKRHIFLNITLIVNQIMMMGASPEISRPKKFVADFTWRYDALIITESSLRDKIYDEVIDWQRQLIKPSI